MVLIFGLVLGLFAFYMDHSIEDLHAKVADLGPWAPVAWSLILVVLLPFMAPVSVLTALSGLAFGPWVGFISAYIGVVGGGWLTLGISRLMGQAWVERVLGHHVKRLEPHLEAHGFFGCMYLRMLPLPYIPVSYLAGLTRIRFWPYAIGTAIGIIPGVLVNSVVAGTVGEVWVSEQGLAALFQPRTYWAIGVVIASIIGPFIIEALRRRTLTTRTDQLG